METEGLVSEREMRISRGCVVDAEEVDGMDFVRK